MIKKKLQKNNLLLIYMTCYFCEKKSREHWGGYWCENCRKLKNLGNVYGFERIYDILEKCCVRNTTQLEKKIDKQNEADLKKRYQGIKGLDNEADDQKDYSKPNKIETRSQKKINKSP